MPRAHLPERAVTEVLTRSRRRCALCFGLSHDHGIVQGQIAHLDQDASNNATDNLAWLCLNHHDQYDSRTSQSKGLTEAELRHYRADLYAFNDAARMALDPATTYALLSADAMALARYASSKSLNGYHLDPQLIITQLRAELSLNEEDFDLAIDELTENGLIELSGPGDILRATNRLFWETDAIFTDNDPVLDAQLLAQAMVSHSDDFPLMSHLAQVLGWSPRRLNPAATYLVEAGYAGQRPALGSAPYALHGLIRTPKTRRYVRDLANGPDAA